MFLGFIDSHAIWTVIHLFGVVVGAGGAYASDFMFFSSVKDERITPTEMRFMNMGSKMVFLGLAVLIASGIALFLDDPERYLDSSKFLAKITVVAVIVANGVFLHFTHIPRLHRHIGSHLPSSDEFMRKSTLLITSGVVSVISWSSAIILGALRSVPYSYAEIMGAYLFLIGLGVLAAIVFREYVLPAHRK